MFASGIYIIDKLTYVKIFENSRKYLTEQLWTNIQVRTLLLILFAFNESNFTRNNKDKDTLEQTFFHRNRKLAAYMRNSILR
jgi:hypothetical protein